MSAALLQYQACLGIMVRLRVEDLTALKVDFEQAPGGRGLSLREFVSVMLDRVSGWEPDTVIPFIEDLVELFAQVDVNGDGTMEWEEFTGAIIEGGMGSSASGANEDAMAEWRDMQYEESVRFVDGAINRPPKRVQFLPEFRRVLLLDNSRPVIELLDPTGLIPPDSQDAGASSDGVASSNISRQCSDDSEDVDNEFAGFSNSNNPFIPQLPMINKFHPLCYVDGYRRDQDDVRSERSPVQAVKFLDGVELLVVSAGDLKLTFWAATLLSAASLSALETPVPLAIVHTPRPQRVLEWNPATQHLFSISADLLISVWRVTRNKSKCEVRLMTTLKKHTDLLQDLLVLNSEILLSCGMDSIICVWDAVTLTPRTTRMGHKRGVRLLTKLSTQMFLSAGFECEVFGWDISPLATTPIFKLWGHNAPVCCIQLIPSSSAGSIRQSYSNSDQAVLLANQAITVDDDGWFKWWSLADVLSVEATGGGDQDRQATSTGSNAECLQTFRLGSDKYPWRAHSLAVLHHGQSVLAAGLHKLKLLQRVRLKPKVIASSAVLFNSVSLTLLTTTDRELRVWDAASGVLLRTHRNISSSDITCIDLDARQRKIVFGTQNGELTVVSYLNGAVLNRWTPHQLQVSALIYCKEDQCVLTASWDRSIRLYDDNAKSNALLRCVTDAHDGDIKCLAYCHALSVFASGSADGTVKIWDYIYFFLEDTCMPPALRTGGTTHIGSSSHGDVNALEFVDPYPLLISGHESGLVCVWELSATHPCSLLYNFFPFQLPFAISLSSQQTNSNSLHVDGTVSSNPANTEDEAESTQPTIRESNISCVRSFFDERGGAILAQDIRRGRFLMIVSNVQGDISVLDTSLLIVNSHARAFREENLPSRDDRSYNPRRRFLRQGKNAKRLNKSKSILSASLADSVGGENALSHHHPPQISDQDIQLLAQWRGHQGNIRCLQVVDEPRGILTCSSDKTVKVWGFDGECLGDLLPTTKPQPSKPPHQQTDEEITQRSLSKSSPLLLFPSDTGNISFKETGSDESTGSTTGNDNLAWKWEVDGEGTARVKREQAERIWDDLKDDKLQALSARRQTMVLARRERRRSLSIHLSASVSAPALSQRLVDTHSQSREASAGLIESHHQDIAETTERLTESSKVDGHAERLFDQLHGKSTWKLSDLQIARQVAWDREREKFRHRMKRIMKNKNRQQQAHQGNGAIVNNQVDEEHGNSQMVEGIESLDSLNPWTHQGEEGLLPTLENPAQDLPFADKDNWAVGSLNRERQMYSHLHHENVRRNSKRLAGSSSALRLRRLETSISQMDLSPSTFLLEKLGSSCVIHENQPLKPARIRSKAVKQKSGMAKAQSMSALSSISHAEASNEELPRQHTIKDLFQQYDKLFEQQEAEEQDIVQRTTGILARGASFRPNSSDSNLAPSADSTSIFENVDPTGIPCVTPEGRAALRKRVGLHSTRRVGESANAQRMPKQTKALGMSPRQSELPKLDRETAAAKKQRLRSDAALMRQDRFGPYSREDVVNIYRTFRKLDQDQSGSITLQELVGGAGLFSGTHMQANIASIFSSVDADQSGQIELPELCHAVFADASANELGDIIRLCSLLEAVDRSRKAKKKQLSAEQLKELEALFKLYDADKNGDVDANELFEALRFNEKFYEYDRREPDSRVTREDVARIIAKFDANSNSTLDFAEFTELFRDDN